MEQQLARKCRINLNKPIYIGIIILDLSKILMQGFHYNYIKNKYGDKAEIIVTDTVAYCMQLKLKMFMKTSSQIKIYLTSVNTQKIRSITTMQITQLLAK